MSFQVFFPQIPDHDFSKQILDTLFGAGWDNMVSVLTSNNSDPGVSMMITILMQINTVAMAILSAMAIFMSIDASRLASIDGSRKLQEKYSTIWAPVRLVVGITMFAPVTKGGVSILTGLLLTGISLSVSFANSIYDAGLDFLSNSGGQVLIHVPESLEDNTHTFATGILKSLVIQSYLVQENESQFDCTIKEKEIPPEKKGELGYTILEFCSPTNYYQNYISKIGAVKIPFSGERNKDPVHIARRNGVIRMINELQPVAKAIVSHGSSAVSDKTLQFSSFFEITKKYNESMVPYLNNIAQTKEFKQDLNFFINTAKKDGWVSAGSYYWTISRFAKKSYEKLLHAPEYQTFTHSTIYNYSGRIIPFIESVDTYVDKSIAMNDQIKAARAGASNSATHKIGDFITRHVHLVGMKKIADFLCNGDPIQNLSSVGHSIIASAEAVTGAYFMLKIASNTSEKFSSSFLGKAFSLISFGASDAGVGALSGFSDALSTFIMFIVFSLISLGFTLAYYLPAIPFILWISAVTGWCILIIETLFSAPFWAISQSIPDGGGLIGKNGGYGWILFLGVLATPPLMVCGYFTSLILIRSIGFILGKGFMIFVASASADHVSGLVSTFAMTAILGGLLVSLSHRIFGLVSHLPENVMKWVGGSVSLGNPQDQQMTRAAFTGTRNSVQTSAETAFTNKKENPKKNKKNENLDDVSLGDKKD